MSKVYILADFGVPSLLSKGFAFCHGSKDKSMYDLSLTPPFLVDRSKVIHGIIARKAEGEPGNEARCFHTVLYTYKIHTYRLIGHSITPVSYRVFTPI